jgi:hypothetical protein
VSSSISAISPKRAPSSTSASAIPKEWGRSTPQAHGSGDQRLDAYTDGYDGGFVGCEVTGLSPVR